MTGGKKKTKTKKIQWPTENGQKDKNNDLLTLHRTLNNRATQTPL